MSKKQFGNQRCIDCGHPIWDGSFKCYTCSRKNGLKHQTTLGAKEWLEQKYIKEKLSMSQIAKLVGGKCDTSSVCLWLKRHKIEARKDFHNGKNNPMFGMSGEKSPTWGKACSEERKKKISLANTGKKRTLEQRKEIGERQKGEKSHFWKGGVTKKNLLERTSLNYKIWRESVFKRDNFVCQSCGDDKGGNLNADHIKPFSLFPELRFEISNGRTLCVDCHKKTETYGRKALSYTE